MVFANAPRTSVLGQLVSALVLSRLSPPTKNKWLMFSFLERMLELTSKTHQDYLFTFSLSRSMDLVIKVMTEVKISEDEYNFIKCFSTQIQGLSDSSQLVTRDLHSGPLRLVVSDRVSTLAKRNSGLDRKSVV